MTFAPSALISLITFYALALALAAGFRRFGLSGITGLLLAAMLAGPAFLTSPQVFKYLAPLGELAILFLLFQAGLEMDPEPLGERPATAWIIGAAGFALPLALGYGAARALGGAPMVAASLGLVSAMSVTAVGPAALEQLRICQSRTGHVILAAAVAGHYLSLAALSIWLIIALPQGFQIQTQGLARAAVPFVLAWIMARFVLEPAVLRTGHSAGSYFCLSMAVLAAMAWASDLADSPLPAAAFLAGQALRMETANREILETVQARMRSVTGGFLAPMLCGLLGAQAEFAVLGKIWALASLLFIAIFVGKVLAGASSAWICRRPATDALATGTALAGSGALPMAAAAALLSTPSIAASGLDTWGICPWLGARELAALILAWIGATAVAPILLNSIVARNALSEEKAAFFQIRPPAAQ